MIQNKMGIIVHLFLDHPSLGIHSWIEDEGGQKNSSESKLHVSASVREKIQEQQQLVQLECSNCIVQNAWPTERGGGGGEDDFPFLFLSSLTKTSRYWGSSNTAVFSTRFSMGC